MSVPLTSLSLLRARRRRLADSLGSGYRHSSHGARAGKECRYASSLSLGQPFSLSDGISRARGRVGAAGRKKTDAVCCFVVPGILNGNAGRGVTMVRNRPARSLGWMLPMRCPSWMNYYLPCWQGVRRCIP